MAVTITATKYFTGTGPIKFSEIRDTFGDLPGNQRQGNGGSGD